RGAGGGRDRRGRVAGQALRLAGGRGAGEWDTRQDCADRGGGAVSDEVLEQLAAEIEALRLRLEHEKLDAEGATEILERITALAQDAMTEIERRADALGEQGH